jgi:hypothetical protein
MPVPNFRNISGGFLATVYADVLPYRTREKSYGVIREKTSEDSDFTIVEVTSLGLGENTREKTWQDLNTAESIPVR